MAALGTMCASVTHEMSNPLSYVLTNLRFLAEELPRMLGAVSDAASVADVTQTLADALEGAERLGALVGSMRSFARADAERRGAVAVTGVVEQAVVLARSEVRRHGQLVTTVEGSPVAWANEFGLLQSLVTLLVHASHLMGHGEPTRTIRVHAATEARLVAISILFDTPPHDSVPTAAEASELAVCRRLVEAQGGALRVTRHERTTLFSLAVPERVQEQADTLPPRAA